MLLHFSRSGNALAQCPIESNSILSIETMPAVFFLLNPLAVVSDTSLASKRNAELERERTEAADCSLKTENALR